MSVGDIRDWEPKILAVFCNWCSYAGADLAGVSRMSYPSNVRIMRVPCSSRVDPAFVLRAFLKGADGVLLSGCHPGDCHYVSGNYHTRRRFLLVKRLLEYIGLESDRFKVCWISASEGGKVGDTVREMTDRIRRLGPNRKMRDDR